MLVLSRQRKQRIRIEHAGQVMILTVIEIKGSNVRIGIDAGNDWRIVRDELPTEFRNMEAGEGPSTRDGSRMDGSAPSPKRGQS